MSVLLKNTREISIVMLLVGSFSIISAQSISGTITDRVTGKPIQGALITRFSDTAQTVTDSLGNYFLDSATSVGIPLLRNSSSTAEKPVLSGTKLEFSISTPQSVYIRYYSLNGKSASIFSRSLTPGIYKFDLSGLRETTNGVYVIRIRLNGSDYLFKTIVCGKNTISVQKQIENVKPKNSDSVFKLSKKYIATDSISISRFGYKKITDKITNQTFSASLDTAILFIPVEGGTFTQGTDDTSRNESQRPAHQVTLSNFLINKYSTTFDDYDAFAVAQHLTKPSSKKYKRGSTPVICIGFYDIVTFANWQSKLDGLTPVYTIDSLTIDTSNVDTSDHKKWTIRPDWNANGYRLLTEAEYEYAARGGKLSHSYLFSGSDTLKNVAWSGYDTLVDGTLLGIQPVGKKQPNELGIYDLSGNTGTLVWDKSLSTFKNNYTADAVVDPRGPEGKYDRRIKRGGGPMSDESCNYVTSRFFKRLTSKQQCFGFRIARSK